MADNRIMNATNSMTDSADLALAQMVRLATSQASTVEKAKGRDPGHALLINRVWRCMGKGYSGNLMSFKASLLRLHRLGLCVLVRVDVPSRDAVERMAELASEIRCPTGPTYHRVVNPFHRDPWA